MFQIAGGILLAVFILYIFITSGPIARALIFIVGAFFVSRVLGGILLLGAVVALTVGGIYFGFQAIAQTKIGSAVFRGIGVLLGAIAFSSIAGAWVFYALDRAKAAEWVSTIAPGGWLLAAIPALGALSLGALWLLFGRNGPDTGTARPMDSKAAPGRIEPKFGSSKRTRS